MKRYVTRSKGITLKRVGVDHFVLDQKHNSIHHLDPIGRAVFRLFEKGMSIKQAQAILSHAFPEVRQARLNRDLRNLVQSFNDWDLLGPVRTRKRTGPDRRRT